MTVTLRKAHTGEPVGEGEIVAHEGAQLYVDSWSPGVRIFWLRRTLEREDGGELIVCRSGDHGLYIGFAGDVRP